MTVDPVALRNLAVSVATAGAERIAARAGAADLRVATKSSDTDPVTEVDREVEALVVTALLAARPHDGVLGEEGAERAGTSGVRWLVDPIDGTVNFIYGLPGCNVSVGAEVDGEVVAGAVVDPLHGDVFAAARGQGATRNGAPIRCTSVADPAFALVGTGFGYDPGTRRRQAEILVEVLPRVRDIRRGGAAAIDICWVACGRLDGFYEQGLQPWDWAAAGLVAAEAGAVVTDLRGEALDAARPGRGAVAAGPHLAGPLLSLVAAAGAVEA